MLDGQIPHLDFISIRPVGTGILFAPWLRFGGDYTIWLARYFVWVEFACIAWIWTILLPRFFQLAFDGAVLMAMALIAFAFTARNFLLPPWHTVDGLWIASIGLLLCLRSSSLWKCLGYCLAGSAVLFKQNYLVVAPVFLFLLQDWRKIRYWMAWLLPGTVYGLFLAVWGALPSAELQLSSHTELVNIGIRAYLFNRFFLMGVMVVPIALWFVSGKGQLPFMAARPKDLRVLTTVGVWILCGMGAVCLALGRGPSMKFGFGVLGMVAGGLLSCCLYGDYRAPMIRAGILVFLMGWASSIL